MCGMDAEIGSIGVRGGRRNRGNAVDPSATAMLDGCVEAVFGLAPGTIFGPSRGSAHCALARQVAMYLSHVVLGATLTATARRFSRDRTTAAHACRLIEDRRDDARFDALLTALETAVEAGLAAGRRAKRSAHP